MAKQILQNFVEEIKNCKCFYDPSDPGYKDLKLKEKKWAKIGEKFNYTARDSQHKWKSLRDRYVRAKRLMEKEIESGNKVNPPKWWLYNYIDSFLSNSVTKGNSSNSQNDVESHNSSRSSYMDADNSRVKDEYVETVHSPENDRMPSTSPSSSSSSSNLSPFKVRYTKKRKHANNDSSAHFTKLVNSLSSTLEKIDRNVVKYSTEDMDDTTLFLLSLAPRIRSLNPHKRSQIRLKFEQTLFSFEAEKTSTKT